MVADGTNQQSLPDSFGNIAKCAADIGSWRDQDSVVALAQRGINEGIRRLNARHVFMFGRKSKADEALVADQNNYGLPSDFFAVDKVQIIDNNTSEPQNALEYDDWHAFQQRFPSQDIDGTPRFWTVKNSFDDEEYLVFPKPSASDATNRKIRLTYFERISEPSADADIIVAPREIQDYLCWYGKWYLVMHKKANDKILISMCRAEWEMCADEFRGSVNRQRDSTYQVTVPRDNNRTGGPRLGRRVVVFRD